jgi:hypothetical protein
LPAAELEAANSANGSANDEAKQLASGRNVGDLKKEAEANEHKRDQKFRDHFERLAIVGLWLGAIFAGLVGVTWLFHVLTPVSCHWLTSEELSKLQNIFTGGVLVSAAGDHWRKRMK